MLTCEKDGSQFCVLLSDYTMGLQTEGRPKHTCKQFQRSPQGERTVWSSTLETISLCRRSVSFRPSSRCAPAQSGKTRVSRCITTASKAAHSLVPMLSTGASALLPTLELPCPVSESLLGFSFLKPWFVFVVTAVVCLFLDETNMQLNLPSQWLSPCHICSPWLLYWNWS